MRVTTKAKIWLAKAMDITFESSATDKGELFYDGELKEGVEVFVLDSEGNYILPENGDYVIGSEVITVENGIVTEIKPNDTTEQVIEQEITEEEVPAPVSETEEVPADKFNDILEVVKELIEEVNILENKVEAIEVEFNKAVKMSKAEPIKSANLKDKEDKKDYKSELARFGLK